MIELGEVGVLFDLDGVLIDSHDQHHAAWIRLSEEIGKPISDQQFAESFGMRNEMCIPHVFKWADPEDKESIADLGDQKEVYYREILALESIDPLPGVLPFVNMLKSNNIPACVGSSTSVLNIQLCLKATGLDHFFADRFVGAEDVENGKPAPDVFLKAAERIGRSPSRCVVVEDAHVGVEAAIAGGMQVIAVTTTHQAATFDPYPVNRIVDQLDEIDQTEFAQLFV